MSKIIFTNNPAEAEIKSLDNYVKINSKWAEGYEVINKVITARELREYLLSEGYDEKYFPGLSGSQIQECGHVFHTYVKPDGEKAVTVKRVTYHPKTLAGLEKMNRKYNPVYEDIY